MTEFGTVELTCDRWIGLGWGWAGDQIGVERCGCKSKEKMEDREDCRKDAGDEAAVVDDGQ